jgi:phage baseplate assembly protein W
MAANETNTNNKPLGLSLPLRLGDHGYFEQNYDTFSQIRTNIINLIRTRPGERRMSPTFGCRIHTTVFEPNTDLLPDIIENIIKEDVSNWVSGAEVLAVDVRVAKVDQSASSVDTYRLNIQVEFRVAFTGQTDVVQLTVDKGLM